MKKRRSPNQKRERRKFTSGQSRPASFTPILESNMASSRFASLEGSIETFIEEQENQNTVKKTKRDVAFLTEFLQTKGETRSETAEIPPAELNELLSEFILSVRTKEGRQDLYEPSSLRGMVASFERHIKRKSYPVSIINDLVSLSLNFHESYRLFLTKFG